MSLGRQAKSARGIIMRNIKLERFKPPQMHLQNIGRNLIVLVYVFVRHSELLKFIGRSDTRFLPFLFCYTENKKGGDYRSTGWSGNRIRATPR